MIYLMYILLLLSLFTIARIIVGPSVWDRILGFNLFSAKFIMIILLYSVIYERDSFIDIAFVYVLLGFISIVFITRFIQRKGGNI